jgi:hypothetical protein
MVSNALASPACARRTISVSEALSGFRCNRSRLFVAVAGDAVGLRAKRFTGITISGSALDLARKRAPERGGMAEVKAIVELIG